MLQVKVSGLRVFIGVCIPHFSKKKASVIEEHVAGQSGFEQLRAMLSAFQNDLFNPHSALRGKGYYYPHITSEKTEAQRLSRHTANR